MLVQSPAAVPSTQVRTWSIAAEAAEAAEDEPRALITAAPRCCTVGMKYCSVQARSTRSGAGLPLTRACVMSGYWVVEWLPQTHRRVMSLTCVPVFSASCVSARL